MSARDVMRALADENALPPALAAAHVHLHEPPYKLRDGLWRCMVGGQVYGEWPDKGTAQAGYATELRRWEARK